MRLWSTARDIADGDLVIVWMTRELIQPLVISAGKELNNRFGVYRHSDLIGMPYGSKVGSRNGKGFIHVLRPTPELWTLALPHRTQILYLADIAFVTSWLDIKPGSKVIEAGTGSGSFSHSTARTIGETGHLWSYEFHEARANKAREEFSRHGIDNTVTLTHRNVCKEGFTVVDTVDAVFLDLPAPWDAVPHAKVALRKDRPTRICCFSPCIEQVMRTVTALNQQGFTDITMYETLLHPQQIDLIPRPPPISLASSNLKRLEIRKEEKRQRQIASAHRGKRKRVEAEEEERTPVSDNSATGVKGLGGMNAKKPKISQGEEDGEAKERETVAIKTEEDEEVPMAASEPFTLASSALLTATATATAIAQPTTQSRLLGEEAEEPTPEKISVSKAFPEVRGHTSYLTFAVLFPPEMTGTASASSTSSSVGTPERVVVGVAVQSTAE
ncbi:tRNA methyltransferase complex GCD14 subunit-domain-containing protein [Irpex rosettiformis]|uniref:tRNA methyltransferase complex GCD14 subunit-domain-containing protein n=1 Tax=Irpex rosettiformis TaxID=378272 RepID=A0ACB8U0F4_9APHY|nr:tRNA methyltransferase complex GCD14 subunit-domain-containing protein [Irpex rosettiformis]